jgi:hypothetical protein
MEQQAAQAPESEAAGFIRDIHEWGKRSKHLYIWDYACNFANYLLPFPNYRSMPANMRTYHKNNIVGVLQQGNFSYGEAAGLSDLECYLSARLMWDPYQDENAIMDDFIRGVYGQECHCYIREYVDLLCDALKGHVLTYKHHTDAPYITDELIEKAELLFEKALKAVKTEKSKWYLQKEQLSVRFMRISRMELEDPRRAALVDALYEDVKRFGIVEIRERKNLDITFENLRNNRYAAGPENGNHLYYIMK